MGIQRKIHSSKVTSNGKSYSYYRKSITIGGKRRDVRAKTKTEWDQKVTQLKKIFEAGLESLDHKKVTVGQLGQFFIEDSAHLRKKTIEEREYVLRAYIFPELADRKLVSLTDDLIEASYRRVIRNHDNGLKKCERMNKILRRLLNWAVRKKIAINISPLPTELMKELRAEFKNSQPHVEERVLSNRDAQLILHNSRETDEEIIVHLQILHGLRIGEALALRHEDIDLINNEIHVRYQSRDGDLTPVKTERSRRSVPLQRPTKMLLLQQGRSFQNGCVYSTHDGLPIRYNNYTYRFFKPLMKRLNLNLRTHDLRRFFASWLLSEGKADIATVSQWLGHSSPSVTLDCYVKVISEARSKSAAAIGDALYPIDEAA